MQTKVFLLLAIVAVVTGAPRVEERIVGGTPITIPPTIPVPYTAEFPYIVSIEYQNSHICGGFIYSANWIVTTASCLENKVLSDLVVVAGQVNLIDDDFSEERHAVFRVVPYDTFDSVTRVDDIALIELSTFIKLDGTTRNYIKFNEVYTDLTSTPWGIFMGWGSTVSGGSFSPRLRYANFTMKEDSAICGSYGAEEFLISKMICVVDTLEPITAAPCEYDEGSPLVQSYGTTTETTIVVGVLSKRSATCDPAEPSVFTRLSVYYAWLYRIAGDQTPQTTVAPFRR